MPRITTFFVGAGGSFETGERQKSRYRALGGRAGIDAVTKLDHGGGEGLTVRSSPIGEANNHHHEDEDHCNKGSFDSQQPAGQFLTSTEAAIQTIAAPMALKSINGVFGQIFVFARKTEIKPPKASKELGIKRRRWLTETSLQRSPSATRGSRPPSRRHYRHAQSDERDK